jgi:hypothetical protein
LTIYIDHCNAIAAAKERFCDEVKELEDQLKRKQKKCKHPKWNRDEQMFYALGETAPGKQCEECGQKRHCK